MQQTRLLHLPLSLAPAATRSVFRICLSAKHEKTHVVMAVASHGRKPQQAATSDDDDEMMMMMMMMVMMVMMMIVDRRPTSYVPFNT